MSHVTVTSHQGHTIVKTVFPAASTPAGMLPVLAETGQAYKSLGTGNILSLVVFQDQEFEQAAIDLLEKVAKANASVVKATAFLGVQGAQSALFKAMISITGRKAKLTSSEAEALAWLVEQAGEEDSIQF